MDDVLRKLDFGSTQERITALEALAYTDNFEIIKKIILKLGDDDIQVRGEAFSSLFLNENKISELLIQGLISDNKYVRGYGALVLANRNDTNSISEIMKLTKDNSSMVRSCALGALGHLRAKQAKGIIEKCITDPNLEVKKSALQAAILIGDEIPENKIKEIEKEKDPEITKLLVKIKRKNGPEGI